MTLLCVALYFNAVREVITTLSLNTVNEMLSFVDQVIKEGRGGFVREQRRPKKKKSLFHLRRLASHLGWVLQNRFEGIKIVGMICDGPWEIVVSLACWRIGIRVFPISSRWSRIKTEELCSLAGVEVVLSDRNSVELLSNIPVVGMDFEMWDNFLSNHPYLDESKVDYKSETGSDDIACVLFSSGTTGKPKMINIRHKAIVWRISEANREIGSNVILKCNLTEEGEEKKEDAFHPVWLRRSPSSFIDSLLEIWSSLCFGGELVYPNNRFDVGSVAKTLQLFSVTHFVSTPTWFRLLFSYMYCLNNGLAKNRFETVRMCIPGGEALWSDDVKKARKLFPNAEIINVYGTTEHGDICWFRVAVNDAEKNKENERLPLGNPFLKVSLKIVNGEIMVGSLNTNGEVLTTGDLGLVDSKDGMVYLIGRKKKDIFKLRGCFVNAKKIESLLRNVLFNNKSSSIPSSAAAQVTVLEHNDKLIARVTDAEKLSADLIAKARRLCKENFGLESVPSVFESFKGAIVKLDVDDVFNFDLKDLDGWPTTTTVSNQGNSLVVSSSSCPNFFEAGGTSIELVPLMTCVARRLGVPYPSAKALERFYENPTPKGLMAVFEEESKCFLCNDNILERPLFDPTIAILPLESFWTNLKTTLFVFAQFFKEPLWCASLDENDSLYNFFLRPFLVKSKIIFLLSRCVKDGVSAVALRGKEVIGISLNTIIRENGPFFHLLERLINWFSFVANPVLQTFIGYHIGKLLDSLQSTLMDADNSIMNMCFGAVSFSKPYINQGQILKALEKLSMELAEQKNINFAFTLATSLASLNVSKSNGMYIREVCSPTLWRFKDTFFRQKKAVSKIPGFVALLIRSFIPSVPIQRSLIVSLRLNQVKRLMILHFPNLLTREILDIQDWVGICGPSGEVLAAMHCNLAKKEIRYLAVEPTFQRRGLGSLLVQHAVNDCDCNFVMARPSAVGFYSRFGFSEVGFGSDMLIMLERKS